MSVGPLSSELETSESCWSWLEDVEMAMAKVMSDLPQTHQTVTVEQPTTFQTESGLPLTADLLSATAEMRSEKEEDCYLSVTEQQTCHYEDSLEVNGHGKDDFYIRLSEPVTFIQEDNCGEICTEDSHNLLFHDIREAAIP